MSNIIVFPTHDRSGQPFRQRTVKISTKRHLDGSNAKAAQMVRCDFVVPGDVMYKIVEIIEATTNREIRL